MTCSCRDGRAWQRAMALALGICRPLAGLQTQWLPSIDLSPGAAFALQECFSTCERVGQMLLRLHQAVGRRLKAEFRIPRPESRTF